MSVTDNLDDARRRALRAEYVGRINRVIDYIEANLAGDLPLETLAGVAAFSPFHFHRIFKAMVGETLSAFIRRRRVEKAASLALQSGAAGHPGGPRVIPPGRLRPGLQGILRHQCDGVGTGRGRQVSKNGQRKASRPRGPQALGSGFAPVRILDTVSNTWSWRLTMDAGEIRIEVKEIPEFQVAYVRHIGPYAGDSALFGRLFGRLFSWAGPRGLIGPQTMSLSLYHDDPEITDEAKLRVDVAISVPEGTAGEGEIGTKTIPGGTYAVAHFEILPDQYGEAWDVVMGQWLPESGYQAADAPCFEVYLNEPENHPEGKHIVDIYEPVKPL